MLKNKNQILISVGVVALIVILFLLGQNNSSSKNNSANLSGSPETYSSTGNAISVSETDYDFGTIRMANGKVNRLFQIKNTSLEPVLLDKLYTSCMCTSALFDAQGKKSGPFGMPGHGLVPKLNRTLNPGEEATIEVVFDPNAHGPAGVGPFERQIYLDGDGSNLLTLQIKGVVTP